MVNAVHAAIRKAMALFDAVARALPLRHGTPPGADADLGPGPDLRYREAPAHRRRPPLTRPQSVSDVMREGGDAMIGSKLKSAREALGQSRDDLATKVGAVGPDAIGRFENDEEMPGPLVLSALFRTLGASHDYLLRPPSAVLEQIVFRTEAGPRTPQAETFKVMERRLLRFIATPALIVVWITGLCP